MNCASCSWAGKDGTEWGEITWNAKVPAGGKLTVTAASSADGVTFGPPQNVTHGQDLTVADGRFLKVRVIFRRSKDGVTPILYDISVATANKPPDCSQAAPSKASLWPPNHKFVAITVQGVTDPEGEAVTIKVTGIRQDEPVDSEGSGKFVPDGKGVGTATAQVRSERVGRPQAPGDGRFYHIAFTATDPGGASCDGVVKVAVPHDQNKTPVDGGPLHDSTRTR